MKNINCLCFILLSSLFLFSGCEDDFFPCQLGKPIGKVSNEKGIIWYNSSTQSYAVYYSVAGSYDTQLVGFICNITDSLRKDGLEITFSGNYYPYNEKEPAIWGQEYYTLELTKIKY